MRRRLPDIWIILLLFALPLVMFWQQTLGGRTLLPTENIFQFEPFYTYREVARAPEVPHNMLVSDLVLENFQWKSFIRQSIDQREIPLWNPHQFAGIPFLAAGQQSTLYPVSLLYYILPLPAAYGWYTVVNLWLAGVFMYSFGRGLGISRPGAALAGIVYQLSGFFIASVVFQMIIGAAAWLPLLLLMVEFIIRQQPALRGRPASLPWVVIGAAGLGCSILAGHVEVTYYTLIILAYYAAARLAWELLRKSPTSTPPHRNGEGTHSVRGRGYIFTRTIWLVVMIALGLSLGAAQFVPLYELVQTNWRTERSSLDTVLSYAHPLRDMVQFVMPNFYGSPAHHQIFDVFSLQNVPVDFTNPDGFHKTNTEWGIKNYVEGALYLGILPLVLAVYALVDRWINRRGGSQTLPYSPPYRIIFALLALISLTFMFGLPTYAALFYGFPGMNQLNSPFRWIFAVTLCIAALAGMGLDALKIVNPSPNSGRGEGVGLKRRIGIALIALGGLILAGLLLSRLLYPQIEPLIERIFTGMAKATEAFPDARTFYSYQFTNVLIFGAMTLGAGVVFLWAGILTTNQSIDGVPTSNPSPLNGEGSKGRGFVFLALALTAVDLMIASWGFNPASDPALLDFTPPAIEWLLNQPGEWRYTTLDDPNQRPLMQANLGWRYGLDDIRGYESIIPAQYVEYMRRVAPQNQLDFNRVAPLYTTDAGQIDWGRLAWLNVRYIITHNNTDLYDYLPVIRDARSGEVRPAPEPVYEDEAVRIWQAPYPPIERASVAQLMPGQGDKPDFGEGFSYGWEVVIDSDTGREKILHANISRQVETSWLVVSESYFPGWRAFVRPRGGPDDLEKPFEVEQVLENFQGVNLSPEVVKAAFSDIYDTLPEDQQTALDNGQLTIRMVYSPASFQVGLFGSFISAIVIVFMLGVWLWRLYVARDEGQSSVAVIARNSLAPIILNLFNRAIDFGFAFVMLRILGPEGGGVYQYAVVIFVWFDIFTNFGLNVFLTREVSRDRSQAWRYFFNTSVLRIVLVGVGVLLLAGFIGARQAFINPELTTSAILTLILLYVGLLPGSLSTGMSALFYAFEKAEYPAAISTVSTISKALFGVAVLLLGYGAVGLAGVSILTNFITLAIMLYVGREFLRMGRGEAPLRPYSPDTRMIRGMVDESWPLMLNHFLATIFFQIDVVIIEAVHGARMVGQYGVAYKWVSALNVIPAFFTMALLPAMSRMAREDRPALKRNYQLAIKLLVSTALPIALLFTFMAYFLTGILGGAEFLPDGAIATQLMIWSIPIGWINSLTQYVLIALDLQRHITRAFIIAVSFNIISNMILIPPFGYRAAALTTIVSELVLLIPFVLLLHNALGALTWGKILWRPLVATGVMLGTMGFLWTTLPIIAPVIGVLIYSVTLLLLRPFTPDEINRLLPLIPPPLRRIPSLSR